MKNNYPTENDEEEESLADVIAKAEAQIARNRRAMRRAQIAGSTVYAGFFFGAGFMLGHFLK